MQNPWTKLSGALRWGERSERLRAIAVLVLLLGVVGAAIYYQVATRSASPALDELSAPGYLRARDRQAEMMMGTLGVTLLHVQDALARPATQAIIIAIVSALVALGCFRAAAHAREGAPPQG